MAVTCTQVGLSHKVVAAGTMVIAVWGDNQSVPSKAGFQAALSQYGEVWQVSIAPPHHVGLTLARNMTEIDLQWALAQSNGGTAANVVSVTGVEMWIDLEHLSDDAQKAFTDSIHAVTEGLSNASGFALWLARYGLWVVGGVVLLVLIIIIAIIVSTSKGAARG